MTWQDSCFLSPDARDNHRYGGDCNMIGQYMWFRKLGYTLYASCDGYTSGPTVIEDTVHYFNFHELQVGEGLVHGLWCRRNHSPAGRQAWTSSCPSLYSMTSNAAAVTLTSLASGGCGAVGATPGATVSTGSRCSQTCAGSNAVQRAAAAAGAAECRSGEWVNSAGAATGALVCGAVCPAVVAPTADATKCSQVVFNATWTSIATGTITDWFPTWRVYKAVSAARMTLLEQEGRATFVSGSYLALLGDRTIFALNEPLWVATPQPSQALSVAVDVRLGSAAAVAGIALRVSSGLEPASFYALKLLNGASGHAISKFVGGVETVLLSVTSGLCTLSTTGWVRVVATVKAGLISATCGGVSLGTATDASGAVLLNGTAGLFHAGVPTVVTNPNNTASAVPAGTFSAYRNPLITRDCDGPGGGCSASLPGEQCVMGCPALTTPAPGYATVLLCNASGSWSNVALVCLPSQTPSMTQTSTVTTTPSQTLTLSQTQSQSQTQTASVTQSRSQSQSATPSPSPTQSQATTGSASGSASQATTVIPTQTFSSTPSSTQSVSQTGSGTVSAAPTTSATTSPSASQAATASSTLSASSSQAATDSQTASLVITATPTMSGTASRSSSQGASGSPTSSSSQVQTSSPSQAPSPSTTTTSSATQAVTQSQAVSGSRTQTSSQTPTASPTPSQATTLSRTGTGTGSPASTPSPSTSQLGTPTQTLSYGASASQVSTASSSATPSETGSASQGVTVTPSQSKTLSGTQSVSPSQGGTRSSTQAPTASSSGTVSQGPSNSQALSVGGSLTASLSPAQTSSPSSAQSPSQPGPSRLQPGSSSQTPSPLPASAASGSASAAASVGTLPPASLPAQPSGSPAATSPAVSATIEATTVSPSPTCVLFNVPVTMTLTGGITPAAVMSPSVGVLARLGLACYLGLPLAAVSVVSASNASARLGATSSDAVNSQGGDCTALSASRALRPSMSDSENSGSVGRTHHILRVLSSAAGSDTTVGLLVAAAACSVAADGSQALSSQLSALFAGLRSAAAAGNTTAAATNATGSAPRFGAFLSAAAGASGVPLAAVSASTSAGTPTPAGAGTAATSPSSDSGATFPIVAVVAAVGGILLIAAVAAAVLVSSRRRRKRLPRSAGTPGATDGEFVAGANPLRASAAVGAAGVAQRQRSRPDAPARRPQPRLSTKKTFSQREGPGGGDMQSNPMRDSGALEQQRQRAAKAAAAAPSRLAVRAQAAGRARSGAAPGGDIAMQENPMMHGRA